MSNKIFTHHARDDMPSITEAALAGVKKAFRGRPRGSKRTLNELQRESILAAAKIGCTTTQIAEVSKTDHSTVNLLIKTAESQGRLAEMRVKSYDHFIEEAKRAIMLGLQTANAGFEKGYVREVVDKKTGEVHHDLSQVAPDAAARAVYQLHQSVQLAEGKPTSIIDRLADGMTEEEIIAEAAQIEAEIQARKGKLN